MFVENAFLTRHLILCIIKAGGIIPPPTPQPGSKTTGSVLLDKSCKSDKVGKGGKEIKHVPKDFYLLVVFPTVLNDLVFSCKFS